MHKKLYSKQGQDYHMILIIVFKKNPLKNKNERHVLF